METTIDLTAFEPKYRQVLLFSMIEGLSEGKKFILVDERSQADVEGDLIAAELKGYQWTFSGGRDGKVSIVIERTHGEDSLSQKQMDGDSCCGCCCGTNKPSDA